MTETISTLIVYGAPAVFFGWIVRIVAKGSEEFRTSVSAMIKQTLVNQEHSLELLTQSARNQHQINPLTPKKLQAAAPQRLSACKWLRRYGDSARRCGQIRCLLSLVSLQVG